MVFLGEHTNLWMAAKKHDIGTLVQIIQKHGFRDPSAYDKTLDAIVAGNGRIEAVYRMWKDGEDVPRNIRTDENGMWYIPILHGVDSETIERAVAYAIDHNNSTMAGGDFTPFDISRMWEKEYIDVLRDVVYSGEMPLTIGDDAFEILCNSNDETETDGEGGSDGEGSDPPIVVLLQNAKHMIQMIDTEKMLDYSDETVQDLITKMYAEMWNFVKGINKLLDGVNDND